MTKIVIIALLSVIMASQAGLAEEKFLIDNETAYKVLNEITAGYGGDALTRYIIVENQDEINSLESKEYDLNFSVTRADFEGKKLEKDNSQKEAQITDSKAQLREVENERNQTKSLLSQVESKKNRLESVINSSVLVPGGSYNAGIAVFIVLLLLALTMKSRSMMLKSHLDIKRKGAEKERVKE